MEPVLCTLSTSVQHAAPAFRDPIPAWEAESHSEEAVKALMDLHTEKSCLVQHTVIKISSVLSVRMIFFTSKYQFVLIKTCCSQPWKLTEPGTPAWHATDPLAKDFPHAQLLSYRTTLNYMAKFCLAETKSLSRMYIHPAAAVSGRSAELGRGLTAQAQNGRAYSAVFHKSHQRFLHNSL